MKKKLLWALLISLLAFFLRAYLAYHGPIEYDEPVYMDAAVQNSLAMRQGNWDQFLNSPLVYEHPMAFQMVYAAGLLPFKPVTDTGAIHFGDPLTSVPYWPKLLALRLIPAFFGAATVFVLSLISPLAGLLLAIHTFGIKYSSVVYMEGLPAFTCLVALVASSKAVESYKNRKKFWEKGWIGWLVLSSLAMGLALASKYVYGVVAFAIVVAVMVQGWKFKGSALSGLVAWGILSLLFFFLFDPVLWHSPIERLSQSIQYHLTYSTSNAVVNASYPFWQPLYWLMLSIPQHSMATVPFFVNPGDYFFQLDSLIFALTVIGLPALYQKNRPMFCWLVIGLAFLLVWETKWPQYVMLVLPPFCLSAAYGGMTLWSLLRRFLVRFTGRTFTALF